MKYKEGELLSVFCQVLFRHAEAISGAYKLRVIKHGTRGKEFTDEEKLEDTMQVMRRQIHRLSDIVDTLEN
jgi:hypothetical protein